MDDKLKEDLKNLNIPEAKIEEISKKKKFVERLKYVLEQAKVAKGDKELGLLLIQLAEKLNPAYNHRLPLLLKYVIPKEISSSQQLDAAIAYLRKKGEEEIDTKEFEQVAGIGVKITPDDITKGRTIMGTGTISKTGKVGEIGGVKYKVLGAVKDGAEIFICPKANEKAAKDTVKKNNLNIKVIGVSTFDEAIEALK